MRIIAGKWRGRTLVAPRGLETRPTTDRVREALFSILGGSLDAGPVLDCYAGSGALGLEALSRGADHVCFIECAKPALSCIRRNIATVGAESCTTVVGKPIAQAQHAIKTFAPFDLVLSDAPWPIAQAAAVAVAALTRGLLSERAVLVLGHPSKYPVSLPEATGLALSDRRSWGDSGLSFFERS